MRGIAIWILSFLFVPILVCRTMAADEEKIKSAKSAAPPSISKNARIKDWDNRVLLAGGGNGWTCLPDNPNTPGNDPRCVNGPWLNFLEAHKKQEPPTYTEVGLAYMLKGDTAVSNTKPFATSRTLNNEWVEGVGPHLKILFPDQDRLKKFPQHFTAGGPWVMWRDTPYAHLVVPLEK